MNGMEMVLQYVLLVITGGGAGKVVEWLIEKLDLSAWSTLAKRIFALVVSAILGVGAWAVLALLGLAARLDIGLPSGSWPQTGEEWLVTVMIIIVTTWTSSQMFHAVSRDARTSALRRP